MRLVYEFGQAALAAGLLLGCLLGGAFAASAEKGKTAYIQHGCWQCHGIEAQGGVTGPKLAPDPIPIETFTAFVRTTSRQEPLPALIRGARPKSLSRPIRGRAPAVRSCSRRNRS